MLQYSFSGLSVQFKKLGASIALLGLISTVVPVSISHAETTVHGYTGTYPKALVMDGSGNIYTANSNSNNVTKITPDGSYSTLGTTGSTPYGIAVDSSGNIYTANANSNNVTKITPEGTSTILGTTGSTPYDIVVDAAGNVYTVNYYSGNVTKITSSGSSSIFGTTGGYPIALVMDGSGNIYTANSNSNNVTKITPGGSSTVFANIGASPYSITIDSAGNLYTGNSNYTVTKITPAGVASTLGTTGSYPYGIAVDAAGNVYAANIYSNTVTKITPSGISRTYGTTGSYPYDIVLGSDGTVYTADYNSNAVSKITPDTVPPVLTNSLGEQTVYQNKTYDPRTGISCSDNIEGTCTSRVDVSGSVNMSTVGDYYISYSYTDASNNVSNTVARTVHVVADTEAPTVTLQGSSEVTIYAGKTYSEAGIRWDDNADGYGYVYVATTGTVDVNTVGNYLLTYTYTDQAGNTGNTVNRMVHVVSDTTPPVITLYGNNPMTVYRAGVYSEPGAYANDNADGYFSNSQITKSGSVNVSTVGTYTITYTRSDAAGNIGTATRTVNVVDDTEPPVITLYGYSTGTIPLNGTYNEQGAYANDNADGFIYDYQITKSGSVDTHTVGTYTITYSYTDHAGNTGTATRTVNVGTDTTPPVITLSGENPTNVNPCQTYYDQGASATDDDMNFNGSVTTSSATVPSWYGYYGYIPCGVSIGTEYAVNYTATDPSGNTATATRVVRVADVYPPNVYLNTSTFTDTSPELSGTIDNDAVSIVITIEGHSYTGTIIQTGDYYNNWILPAGTIDPPLSSGQHTVNFTAVDTSGNVGNNSPTINIALPVDISFSLDLINTGTILSGNTVTYRSTINNNGANATSTYLMAYYIFPKKLDIGGEDYGYGYGTPTTVTTSNSSIECSLIPWDNFSGTNPFSSYENDYSLVVCGSIGGGAIDSIPGGGNVSFDMSFTATEDFVNGDTAHGLAFDFMADTELNAVNTWANSGQPLFDFVSDNVAHAVYPSGYTGPVLATGISLTGSIVSSSGTFLAGETVTHTYKIKNESSSTIGGSNAQIGFIAMLPTEIGFAGITAGNQIPTNDPNIQCIYQGLTTSQDVIDNMMDLTSAYGEKQLFVCYGAITSLAPGASMEVFSLSGTLLANMSENDIARAVVVAIGFSDPESSQLIQAIQNKQNPFAFSNNNTTAIPYHTVTAPINNSGGSGGGGSNILYTFGNSPVSSGSGSTQTNTGNIYLAENYTLTNPLTDKIPTAIHQVVPMENIRAVDLGSEFRWYIMNLISYGIVDNALNFHGEYNITRAEFIKMIVSALHIDLTDLISQEGVSENILGEEVKTQEQPNTVPAVVHDTLSPSVATEPLETDTGTTAIAIVPVNLASELPMSILSLHPDASSEQDKTVDTEKTASGVSFASGTVQEEQKTEQSQESEKDAQKPENPVHAADPFFAKFSDITTPDEFTPFIQKALQEGWIKGYADGTFRPYANISRGEAIKILARAIGLKEAALSGSDDTDTRYKDVPNVHEFAGDIYALTQKSILKGREQNYFGINDAITRQEVAKILYKVFLTSMPE